MDLNAYELAVIRTALIIRRAQLHDEQRDFKSYSGYGSKTITHEIETLNYLIMRSYDVYKEMEKK